MKHDYEEMSVHLQTAVLLALLRDIESHHPEALFKDPYANKIALNESNQLVILRIAAFDEGIKRYFSELEGKFQFVNFGAGFDMRPFRMKELEKVDCYDIDFPLVMHAKKMQLNENNFNRPNYHIIEADLESTPWDQKLLEEGFKTDIPAIWLAEGLIYYLNPELAVELVNKVYTLSAPKSIFLLDFVTKSVPHPSKMFSVEDPDDWMHKLHWSSTERLILSQKQLESHSAVKNSKLKSCLFIAAKK